MDPRVNSNEDFESIMKSYFANTNYAEDYQMDSKLINYVRPSISTAEYSSGAHIHSSAIGFLVFLGLSIVLSLSMVLYNSIKARIESKETDTNSSSSDEELSNDRTETNTDTFPPITRSRETISSNEENNLRAGYTAVDISASSSFYPDITIPSFSYGGISLSSIVDFPSSL